MGQHVFLPNLISTLSLAPKIKAFLGVQVFKFFVIFNTGCFFGNFFSLTFWIFHGLSTSKMAMTVRTAPVGTARLSALSFSAVVPNGRYQPWQML